MSNSVLMEKVLSTLLENEVLNEETKSQLEEAVKETIREAVEIAKSEAEVVIRADLTEQYLKDKEALVEALDTKASEYIQKEIIELKEDIDSFKDLEVEYAERLVEHKAEQAAILKSDLEKLVDAMDVFIEMRLQEEMNEFEESINEVKKINFGKEIFEHYEQTYLKNFADTDSSQVKLDETKAELVEKEALLTEAQGKLDAVKRDAKMEEVLSELAVGRSREIMEAVLNNVPTDQLDVAYGKFISRVLHESAETIVENEDLEKEETEVLAESDTSTKEKEEVVIKTGDSVIEESTETDTDVNVALTEAQKEMRFLAGIGA